MKKRFITLFIAIMITGLTLALFATKHAKAEINTVDDLTAACNNAPEDDGLGQVTLPNSLTIQNADVAITTPCEIHLTNGASIKIHNSKLTTNNLAIVDDQEPTASSSVSIENSTIKSDTGGLFVKLYHGGDNISVQHATIDYPLSVVMITTDTDDTNNDGTMNIEASTISSNGTPSDGIVLVSTGKGVFVGNTFNTTDLGNTAILSAPTCTMVNNTNAIPQCSVQ